jgi:cytochrome c oxidase subunit IV
MSTHAESRMPHEPHGVSVPTPHHEVPYFLIFAALLVLTAITVAIAFIKFPTELINVLLALAVAFVKGSLVAMFFMHLKFEGKLIYMMVIIPLILCVLIICALIPDILMTGADSHSASLHLFNPPAIPK